MKILFFEHPRISSDEHYNDVANAPLSACLNIGYAAAALKKSGHSVEIYDAFDPDAGFRGCEKELLQRDFDMLAVHAVYFWEHTPQLFFMLERFAKIRPNASIVLFGFFPTFAGDLILERFPCIRAAIIGEPELTLAELARALEAPHPRMDQVAGIAYRDGDRVCRTVGRKSSDNLDALPFPLRYESSLSRIGGSILGSRGCGCACSFCCIHEFYSSGRRCRSAGNIAREVAELIPRLERPYVYFLDPDFFGPGSQGDRSRIADLAGILRELGVSFGLECRAGSFDEGSISQLNQAGLEHVFLGVESASAASLKRMRKGISPVSSADSIGLLRSLGIEPQIGFIMFEPDSTLADVRDNFIFLRNNGLLQKLDTTANVLYHREIVLKGMPDFDRLSGAGRLTTTDMFGYEGKYRFADEGTQFMADLMSRLCRRVLRAAGNARSPICWKRGETAASLRVNGYLVSLFSDTVRRLELRDIPSGPDGMLRIEEEAVSAIEGLIVEERVCQS